LINVVAEQYSVQVICLTAALEESLDDEIAANVSEQFIRQPRGFESRCTLQPRKKYSDNLINASASMKGSK